MMSKHNAVTESVVAMVVLFLAFLAAVPFDLMVVDSVRMMGAWPDDGLQPWDKDAVRHAINAGSEVKIWACARDQWGTSHYRYEFDAHNTPYLFQCITNPNTFTFNSGPHAFEVDLDSGLQYTYFRPRKLAYAVGGGDHPKHLNPDIARAAIRDGQTKEQLVLP